MSAGIFECRQRAKTTPNPRPHVYKPHRLGAEHLRKVDAKRRAKFAKANEELVAKGYLEDSGERRLNPATGEFEIVWRMTESGIRHVERDLLGLKPKKEEEEVQ